MASRRLVLLVAATALAACAAGGVDNLSLPSMPLVHVKGHVDVAAAEANAGGHKLLAALVWGAVPNYNQACIKYPANADLQKACPNPFGFVPGQLEQTAPVAADGTFDFALDHLPSASVSVGTDASRIAWGSVVVAADTDDNGQFDLVDTTAPRGSTSVLADQVVAASFDTLTASQERVGFLEGTWDGQLLGLFYPYRGCPSPRPGFQVLSTPGLTVKLGQDGTVALAAQSGKCTDDTLSQVVEATPLSVDEGKAFACRSVTNRLRIQQPTDTAPGPKGGGGGGRPGGDPGGPASGPGGTTTTVYQQVCLDPQTLALVGTGDCPSITVLPLAGCRDDLTCKKPDWDLTKNPPSWWPCH